VFPVSRLSRKLKWSGMSYWCSGERSFQVRPFLEPDQTGKRKTQTTKGKERGNGEGSTIETCEIWSLFIEYCCSMKCQCTLTWISEGDGISFIDHSVADRANRLHQPWNIFWSRPTVLTAARHISIWTPAQETFGGSDSIMSQDSVLPWNNFSQATRRKRRNNWIVTSASYRAHRHNCHECFPCHRVLGALRSVLVTILLYFDYLNYYLNLWSQILTTILNLLSQFILIIILNLLSQLPFRN